MPRLRCCRRRPTGWCRHPARLRWPPPSSARPSRHRAPPGTGVRGRAGSRGRRRCTDRAWPTQGIDGGRYRGCQVRKHPSGSRSPPVPAPQRPDKYAPESKPTRGARIRRQSCRYRVAASPRRWFNESRTTPNRFDDRSVRAVARWRNAGSSRCTTSASASPCGALPHQTVEWDPTSTSCRCAGGSKVYSVGRKRRVIPQNARALRGHWVTTRPLGARK